LCASSANRIFARIGSGSHASEPHAPYQALHALAVNFVSGYAEHGHHPARPIKWVPRKLFVEQPLDKEVILIRQTRFFGLVNRGAGYPGQSALPRQCTPSTASIQPCLTFTGLYQTFFEPIQFDLQPTDLAVQHVWLAMLCHRLRATLALEQRLRLLL